MSLQYDEITKEEFDRIPDEYYYGQSRYVAESWEGNKIFVLVTLKSWEENDQQYEARKYEVWYDCGLTNYRGRPDDVKYTQCELHPYQQSTEKDIVREIADAYWRECHDEFVREQIESGESTMEEMAAAFCDATHWVERK